MMGKRGRKPGVKQDGVTKLERSRMSARDCRVRKKLRYEYLEELVKDRERAICIMTFSSFQKLTNEILKNFI
jgi:hypothetical protein